MRPRQRRHRRHRPGAGDSADEDGGEEAGHTHEDPTRFAASSSPASCNLASARRLLGSRPERCAMTDQTTFSLDEAIKAQRSLRQALGLGEERFEVSEFVEMISDEIEQM